jgi:hypothetical protein
MSQDNRRKSAPTDEDLTVIGFEEWQITLIRQLAPHLQWVAYDEFVRRLMSNQSTDSFYF